MKSVGEILRLKREEQSISIPSLSSATKIKEEYIEDIEHNAFSKLPSGVAAQGYVATIATYLDLNPESMVAFLRRDFNFTQDASYPQTVIERKKLRERKTTLTIVGTILATLCIVVASYGFWSYQRVRQSPPLTVFSPRENDTVVSDILVRGQTATDAVVEVDAETVGVTQDGEFMTQLELLPGKHVITVTAKNRYGKSTVKQILITVEE